MAITTETYQTWLDNAETALNDLMTGKRTVSATYNGRSVTYNNTAADLDKLKSYISYLKTKVDGKRTSRRIYF
ncbi:MAG: hypothetical protein GC153_13055 [Alphaproteobacteria bacterium]|nr:hypothetical protein [Alphaproteobacteria bacterium]